MLLVLPILAWLAGARQPLVTNESKESFPVINRSSVRDPQTFRRIETAILDRLPFREQALRLHASILIDAFRESPNPDVGIGSGGWRYFRPELTPCRVADGPALNKASLEALDLLAGALAAGGYESTVTIVAGKQFVHVRNAYSFDKSQERCMRRLSDTVDLRLRRLPGGLPLNPELRAIEAKGHATFLKTDTHWNWRGREFVARRLLDRLRPGLANEVGLAAGDWQDRPTDMHNMVGQFGGTERDRGVGIQRLPKRLARPGSVVMFGDSQLGGVLNSSAAGMLPIAAALPGQALFCRAAAECPAELAAADVVVYEKVLRDFHSLQFECAPAVAIAAERSVGTHGRYVASNGGAASATRRRLDFPDGGSATVSIVLPGPTRAAEARLLKLPVVRLGANPDGTPPQVNAAAQGVSACSTTTATAQGRSLVLSVAAGRPITDVALTIDAPPGSILGPPEEIRLDGISRRVPR